MLDQNTDRMWYVIGAVLVGAAIILIANATLPEIFASVTNSFKNVSNDMVEVVNDISVNTEGSVNESINYFSVAQLQEGIDQKVSDRTGRWRGITDRQYNSYILELELKPNTKYKLSSNAPSDIGTSNETIYLNHYSNEYAAYNGRPSYTISDPDGYLFVGMPKGRQSTEGIRNGKYWVRLEEVKE